VVLGRFVNWGCLLTIVEPGTKRFPSHGGSQPLTRKTFLRNHAGEVLAYDFFVT